MVCEELRSYGLRLLSLCEAAWTSDTGAGTLQPGSQIGAVGSLHDAGLVRSRTHRDPHSLTIDSHAAQSATTNLDQPMRF